MNFYDRLMLRKRTIIESVNDFIKNVCDIWHCRHRSVTNFIINLVSALEAYSFLPKKVFYLFYFWYVKGHSMPCWLIFSVKLTYYYGRILLCKHSVIEFVNDFLKNICNVEHSKHRSVTDFLVNLFSNLVAYSFLPKKPSVFHSTVPDMPLLYLDF